MVSFIRYRNSTKERLNLAWDAERKPFFYYLIYLINKF